MTDPTPTASTAETPSAPVQETMNLEATPSPAVDTPAVEQTPAPAENTPAPESAEAPAEKSLLGADDAAPAAETPEEDKNPDDAEKPAEGDKKEEASQSVEPAPLPTYEPFTLPDGVQIDDKTLGEFTTELGEIERLTGADHAKMQEFGQKLVDRHTAVVNETLERLTEYYSNTWEKQKTDWKDAFENDPEIGGNRKDTTLKEALSAIRTYGGSAEQQQELRSLMNQTGVGNNPALIRLLAKAGAALAEGKPVPATSAGKGPTSKIQKRYGNNNT
jgi:hypothetical protein